MFLLKNVKKTVMVKNYSCNSGFITLTRWIILLGFNYQKRYIHNCVVSEYGTITQIVQSLQFHIMLQMQVDM